MYFSRLLRSEPNTQVFLFNIEFILIVLKNNINYHPHLDDSLTLRVHAQSCTTLCEPLTAKDCHGLQTAKLLCLWDVPGKNSGVGCQFPLPGGLPDPQIEPASPVQRLYHWATRNAPLTTYSEVAQSCPTLCDPMDYIAHQAPQSMEFSRQEYWSGLPFP